MAADDTDVVVTLRANLKDYEAALKSAVRTTEKAAQAASIAVSNIGKGAGSKAPGKAFADGFKQSTGQIANDARVMQYQLNDIFSGLATGQGVRAVEMQLGQIAQQLSGGGIVQGAKTIGTAFMGMLNPISLAVVGFGLLATAAASYFENTDEQTKKANEELEKHAAQIQKLATNWGHVVPGLKDYADKLKRATSQAELLAAVKIRQVEEVKKGLPALKELREGITDTVAKFQELNIASADTISTSLFDALAKAEEMMGKGKPATEEFAAAMKILEDAAKNADAGIRGIAQAALDELDFEGAAKSTAEVSEKLAQLDKAAKTIIVSLKDMATIIGLLSKVMVDSIPGLDQWLEIFKTQFPDAFNGAKTAIGGFTSFFGEAWEKAGDAMDGMVSKVIKGFEDFRAAAYWDKNHWRVGFGSDTYVDEMGKIREVTESTVVTLGQANQDLARRIGEFQTAISRQIGPDMWKSFSENQQAALTSIAYNYGSLPDSIVKAIQTGDRGKVANAIASLSANPDRRKKEAEMFGGDRFDATPAVEKKNYDDLITSINAKIEAQQRENAINSDSTATVDEKTAALQREKAAQEAARVEQELNNAAQAQGIPLTDALKAKNHELAQEYASLGLAADQLATAQKTAAKAAADQAQAAQQFSQQIASMAQSAIGGLINDLRNGVEAGEAFNNMLNRIIDSLIQMALQSLFSPAGGGGLFSMLFGGAEKGGRVGGGLPKVRRSPLVFAGAPRYAAGGMVGLKAGEIPIIAHRGEIVIPNVSKAMAGGAAAMSAAGGGRGGDVTNNVGDVNIDMSKTGLVASSSESGKLLGRQIQTIVAGVLIKESRPGGILRKQPGAV